MPERRDEELSVEARRHLEELRLDELEVFCRYFLAVHAEVPNGFESAMKFCAQPESVYDLVAGDREYRELAVEACFTLAGALKARQELADAVDHVDIDLCNLAWMDGALNGLVQQIVHEPPDDLVWISGLRRRRARRAKAYSTGIGKTFEDEEQARFAKNAQITRRMDQFEASGVNSRNLPSEYKHRYRTKLSLRTLSRIRDDREKYRRPTEK